MFHFKRKHLLSTIQIYYKVNDFLFDPLIPPKWGLEIMKNTSKIAKKQKYFFDHILPKKFAPRLKKKYPAQFYRHKKQINKKTEKKYIGLP